MDLGPLKRDVFEVWMPYGEDGQVLIRHVPMDKLEKINRASTVRSWDLQHRQEERVDPMKRNRLYGAEAVRDWKGLTVEGEDLPFTPENRDLLMTKSMPFASFAWSAGADLQAMQEEEIRQAEKNSGLTSGQGQTSLA